MKKLIFVSLIILAASSCASNSSKPKAIPQVADVKTQKPKSINVQNYIYRSDSIDIYLSILKEKNKVEFDIHIKDNSNNTYKIKNKADLILEEDENGNFSVPEQAPVLDSSTNEEYVCDSTFAYYTDKLNITFGFEAKTNKRISLSIYKSNINFIKDNDYTLYRKN
jgi:hypothetical protein